MMEDVRRGPTVTQLHTSAIGPRKPGRLSIVADNVTGRDGSVKRADADATGEGEGEGDEADPAVRGVVQSARSPLITSRRICSSGSCAGGTGRLTRT